MSTAASEATQMQVVPPTTTPATEAAVLVDTAQLRKAIKSACSEVMKLRGERDSINQEVGAILADMKSKGVPPDAFKRALKDVTLDEQVLEQLDYYHAMIRQVLDRPIQGDLFGHAKK